VLLHGYGYSHKTNIFLIKSFGFSHADGLLVHFQSPLYSDMDMVTHLKKMSSTGSPLCLEPLGAIALAKAAVPGALRPYWIDFFGK
jgi:hypothetical protein